MCSIAVVTDSVADLPHHVAEELRITVVPLVVRFGSDVYRDGFDLNPDQFYGKLKTNKVLPLTSVPSPATFADAYDKLAEKNDIMVITLTSKLSATYKVALQSIRLNEKAMSRGGRRLAMGGYGTEFHSNYCCQGSSGWG